MTSGYYDITSKTLGKGHYGVVKLGRHCLTGEPVAMKIIEKSRLNKDSLNQLGTEIRILFRLSEYEHPNILKLYQTIDTEDKLYLVTEYCGPYACDLHDYLLKKHHRDGLAEREAQIFFVQICSAISYCHSMGIVHRDLKPENILVTDYKHLLMNNSDKATTNTNDLQYPLLKLIDFGFANSWFPDEKMRTSCGTLAYSAPELLLGEAYDGTKVDVWGLGLMLYILLYGGNPFMQVNDNETLTKILDCSFSTPLKDNVDKNAVELLKSMIKRNPESRLTLEDIEQHAWFSNVPKSSSNLVLKHPIKIDHSPSTMKQPTPDNYIYATYQLTRDKSHRLKQHKSCCDTSSATPNEQIKTMDTTNNQSKGSEAILEEEIGAEINGEKTVNDDRYKRTQRLHQRKLLQPQHKMRDKFTSFFRTTGFGSSSTNLMSTTIGDHQQHTNVNDFEMAYANPMHQHHEAFSEQHTLGDIPSTVRNRYFGAKTMSKTTTTNNPSEISMAYVLPLARKCSLVSEESACLNESPENQ